MSERDERLGEKAQDRCVNCGAKVVTINYALGPELMHVSPGVSFATERKGTAWRYCQVTVAELPTPPGLPTPPEDRTEAGT